MRPSSSCCSRARSSSSWARRLSQSAMTCGRWLCFCSRASFSASAACSACRCCSDWAASSCFFCSSVFRPAFALSLPAARSWSISCCSRASSSFFCRSSLSSALCFSASRASLSRARRCRSSRSHSASTSPSATCAPRLTRYSFSFTATGANWPHCRDWMLPAASTPTVTSWRLTGYSRRRGGSSAARGRTSHRPVRTHRASPAPAAASILRRLVFKTFAVCSTVCAPFRCRWGSPRHRLYHTGG